MATSGSQDCPVGTLRDVRVGDVTLPPTQFALGEFDLDDAGGGFVDGLLGIDALGALRFSVDSEAQAAHFDRGTT
jgi:hypothetical protein